MQRPQFSISAADWNVKSITACFEWTRYKIKRCLYWKELKLGYGTGFPFARQIMEKGIGQKCQEFGWCGVNTKSIITFL